MHSLQNLGFNRADREPSQTTTEQPLDQTSQGKSALTRGFSYLGPDSTHLLLAAAGPTAGQEGILPSYPHSEVSSVLYPRSAICSTLFAQGAEP